MKRIAFLMGVTLLTGCVRVGWIQAPERRLVDERGTNLNVVGNPHITCYRHGKVIADGYFVRYVDGILTVDEFGKGYVYVTDPTCKLGGQE
jgi:hypothetical protein